MNEKKTGYWADTIHSPWVYKGGIVCLLLISILIYLNALPNQFVWDDEQLIVNNLVIRDWSNWRLAFTSGNFYAGGAGLQGGFYRPLVTLINMLNYQVWGLSPAGFRLVQILLHAVNTLLIFQVIKITLTKIKFKKAYLTAFTSSLIFAVHPVNVESVPYVASLGGVLGAFFMLISLRIYQLNFQDESISMKYSYLFISYLLAFVGLFAHEEAGLVLLLFILYTFLFGRPNKVNRLVTISGSFLVAMLYIIIRLVWVRLPLQQEHNALIAKASFWQRIITIPSEVWEYLKVIFWPVKLQIYRDFVVGSAGEAGFWLPLIFILAIFILAYKGITRTGVISRKLFVFYGAWFLLGLLPILNLIPLDMTVAERWVYIPLVGIITVAVIVLVEAWLKLKLSFFYFYLLVAFLVVLLGLRTLVRNTNWRNGLKLYAHDLALTKDNFSLENNYGVELYRDGQSKEAERHFYRSVDLNGDWSVSRNNLGVILERRGELEGALHQYQKAVEISDYYIAHENLANLLIKVEQNEEAKKAIQASLRIFPANSQLKMGMGIILFKEGKNEDSARWLEEALKDNPANQQVLTLLNLVKSGVKYQPEALK